MEPDEPRRFEPSAPRYLPRLWKEAPASEPEKPESLPSKKRKRREAEAEAKKAGSKAKAGKKKQADFDDGTGASKLEETPVLDTYETRQRIRWALTAAFGAVGLLGLFLIVRAFRGSPPPEAPGGLEAVEAKAAANPRPNPELEANVLIENARQADKAGRTPVAVETLTKVAKVYQGTAAAKRAMEALERNRKSLPLFGVAPIDQATGPKPPPEVKQAKADRPAPTAPMPPKVAPGGAVPLAMGPNPPKEGAPVEPGSEAAPRAEAGSVPKGEPAVVAKPLPSGFHPRPGTSFHPSGWPMEILCDRDNAPMVLVPGAVFLMGRDDGEPSERPAHKVKLSTYYIDLHEVTVGQYQQYLGETNRPALGKAEAAGADLPMVMISAREAKAYCNWANRHLPTEAQWELAARSADGRVSLWSGEPPRKDPAKGSRPMEPVMTLAADRSPFGAFDLGGNAWEWTGDWYDAQYYHQQPPLPIDPTGPPQSRVKGQVAVRGGSKLGVLTEREGVRIEAKLPYLGFRGALPVDPAPAAAGSPKGPAPAPNLPGSGEIPF